MPDTPRLETRGHIHLVIQKSFTAVDRDLVASDGDLVQRRSKRDRRSRDGGANLAFGDAGISRVIAVAYLIAECQRMIYIVLNLDCADVDIRLKEVAVAEAVVVFTIHRSRRVEEPGNAVVGSVVGGLVEVAERNARGSVEPKRERRRNADATAFSNVAPGNAGIMCHQVQAEGRAAAESGNRLIHV